MARDWYTDDDGDGASPGLWHRTVQNAISGRRGQAALRQLEQALLCLPAPRLGQGHLYKPSTQDWCPIGALARYTILAGKAIPYYNINSLTDLKLWAILENPEASLSMEMAQELGCTGALAWWIGSTSDELGWYENLGDPITPEERYTLFLSIVRKRIRDIAPQGQ